MPNHQKHLSSLRIQHGQAMIEYAILLILFSIMFIGGAELGKTALASYKNTDAAKTAISEYADINQKRLNILNAEKQYLTTLAGYGCVLIDVLTTSGKFSCLTTTATYDSFQAYLDAGFQGEVIDQVGTPVALDIDDIADFIHQYAGYSKETTAISNPAELPSTIILALDADADTELTTDELLLGEDLLKDSGFSNLNSTDKPKEGRIKYTALLLIEHLKLSKLPLNPDEKLSVATLMLADHSDVTNITEASCNGNVISYGLPNRYPYHDEDDNGAFELNQTEDRVIYLFHPLPINITNCTGDQINTLVNGKGSFVDADGDGDDDDGDFVPGLPKLNQAMYSLYTRVCVNANNEYVSCNGQNVASTLLKPPGKICFANGGANADTCATQPDQVTGFYRWAKGSDSNEKFVYAVNNVNDELSQGFRPTFQLDCSAQPNVKGEVDGDFGVVSDTNCQSNPSKVRIHTRYRSVFEGFLTFGLQELDSNNAMQLFYNPNNVGAGGTDIVGIAGSEIGPIGTNGRGTFKPHKDFRGCYEVDVETNQVSSCS